MLSIFIISSKLKLELFSSNFFLILIPSSIKKTKNFFKKYKFCIKTRKKEYFSSKKEIKLLKSLTFSLIYFNNTITFSSFSFLLNSFIISNNELNHLYISY